MVRCQYTFYNDTFAIQGDIDKDVDRGPSNASILLYKSEKNPILRCASDICTVWGLNRSDFR